VIIELPGLVDPHVHLRDLDWSHKADFASETAAAVAGGYWAVFDMPNTPPTTTTAAALQTKATRMRSAANCDWGLYYGASQHDNSDTFARIPLPIAGLKIYNNATTGDLLIEDQALRGRMFARWVSPRPIAVHAEGDTVRQILDLVRQYRRHVHFCHISTAHEIELLQAAKEARLPISVGVCPHHLYLTEDDLPALGPFGLMKPSLKTRHDRDRLWQAIDSGVVDLIESDHAPHTRAEKLGDVPPFGVPGLETTVALVLTAVHEGRVSLERAADLLGGAARRIWSLDCPPDTLTRIDLSATATISASQHVGRSGWTPFEGMRTVGRVIETRIRGVVVFDGEELLAAPGFGEDVFA
jgi:dihydroorotase